MALSEQPDDLDLAYDQYLSMADELTLDPKEFEQSIYADVPLINRSQIQDVLDRDASVFSARELARLKEKDQFVLDNVKLTSEWVRRMAGEPDEPHSHWWWYLDFIADKTMPAPDLDEIYAPLIEKADKKSPRVY